MTLEETIRQISPADGPAMEEARRRWDSIAKPLHSLGLLEDAVTRMAGMRADARKVEVLDPCVVVMCADNGVVAQGVTQTGQEVTAVVARNFTTGSTSVCRMAEVAGARVVPVDVGIAADLDAPGLLVRKTARGTRDMSRGPAMTREEAVLAIEAGVGVARELAGRGSTLLATGEMGIGNTTTSSAVTSVLLRKSVPEVTGKGAGLTREGVRHKVAVIRQAVAVNRPDPNDVLDTLAKVGGFDIAGLAGVYLGGASMRVPVMIDGFISAAAALCAVRLCPAAADYLMPSHVSGEPAGRLLLDELKLAPFLTCGMCLGEGTGAVAAIPLLKMACAVYNEMSTFEDIRIDEYKPLD